MLKFKNAELAPTVNFLGELKLKGKASRGRTKLITVLSNKYEEFQKDIEALKEEFQLPETPPEEAGELKEYQEKVVEHNKQFNEILEDDACADFSEYKSFLPELISGLYDSDTSFNGQDAIVYDLLLEQLEKEGDE